MLSLETAALLHGHVGYGALGTAGDLGYEGKRVTVQGIEYDDALSTHPPARVLYYLGGEAREFRCQVALNGDVAPGASHADFAVCADGREVATALEVTAGESPRDLVADVSGAHLVELLVSTSRFEFCHAVWLNPSLDATLADATTEALLDPLGRSELTPLPPLAAAERCVVVAASAGYEALLDDALGSLVANGDCTDARLVVMLLGECGECERIVAKYRALPVRCRPRVPMSVTTKAALYAVARVVDAQRYLCLDADTIVLGSLAPVFAALDALPRGSVLAAREGNGRHFRDLGEALEHELVYRGKRADIDAITGVASDLGSYPLVVNGGLFAGSREGLIALDAAIRGMPGAAGWIDAAPELPWREQFVFNLALAQLDCGVELDGRYNVQLHTTDVEAAPVRGRPTARWEDAEVAVLHLNGTGRGTHADLSGRYCVPLAALAGGEGGDAYGDFLRALRRWVGLRGIEALAWSFYSTRDGLSARVRDPSVLPVLAMLHYLVRANGCRRVFETGTARGVSAACIASALAHRPGGRMVTFDPVVDPDRADLWAELPEAMRRCIEERTEDARAGMQELIDTGESFDAALLDSEHTETQLWAEFELARQAVAPSGLILIHDASSFPEVARTLDQIEASGYNVTRLLALHGGDPEDAGLGLAVVENRPRRAGGES